VTTTWNPSDASNINFSNTNHTATDNGSFGGCRGTTSHLIGKWYIELAGMTTQTAANGAGGYGVALAATVLAATAPLIGVDTLGAFQPNNVSFGQPDGHVLALALDFDNDLAWARYDNGSWVGNGSGGADPATATNGNNISSVLTAAMFPFCSFRPIFSDGSCTMNAGDTSFAGSVPSGFTGWDFVPPPNTKRSFATVMS
jgi:hypothetical protein